MAKKSKYKSKDKARQKRKRQQEKQRRANLILNNKRERQLELSQVTEQIKSSVKKSERPNPKLNDFSLWKNKNIPKSDEFDVGQWYEEQDITQAYEEEELHEEVVVLDNFYRLLDMINNFDSSKVESKSGKANPRSVQQKYVLTEQLKEEIQDAIESWNLRGKDGEKQVAKAINRNASEIFEAVTRIMYKVYEMMNAGGKYDPSADIAFFVSTINFEDVDTFTIMPNEDIPF